MGEYLEWHKKIIEEGEDPEKYYARGYVFGRFAKGGMSMTRSLRIDLDLFELTSENRRILAKTADLESTQIDLPIPAEKYDWKIHKLGKDFYEQKFGPGIFSARRLQQVLTDAEVTNFNKLFHYKYGEATVGYVVCYLGKNILHYAYPFYDLQFQNNYGMSMMLRAILFAKESGLKYVYLGSATKPADKYKLQFKGLQWFDGKIWSADLELLKKTITV